MLELFILARLLNQAAAGLVGLEVAEYLSEREHVITVLEM